MGVHLEICGIDVEFPFPPYDSQLIYMEKVILALKSKQNAILESPTGTGKTLCLLCATLAWRKHFEQNLRANGGSAATPAASGANAASANMFSRRSATPRHGRLAYEGYDSGGEDEREAAERDLIPRIIYSSRTHSQLKQVVQELRNTSYSPRVAVLGSREHLCVNEKISQMRGTKQNFACRDAVKRKSCVYKRGFDSATRRNSKQSVPILDIEELVETMKEKEICPFFLSRNILPDAEIIFVPYNYLIDPLSRRSIGISIENSVLIFDEAHNVESIASDAASHAMSSADIAGCVAEVQQFIQALYENKVVLSAHSNLSAESAETLKALLLEIDKGLNSFPLSSTGGFTKPGEYIFDFFQQFNVNFDTCPLVLSMIEEIIEHANEGGKVQTTSSKLDALLSFLGTIFRNRDHHMTAAKNYRVHIQEVQDKGPNAPRLFNSVRKSKATTRVFNYWCFHPGVSFREICANNVYNVILTSGTLSPLETTIKELGIDFPVRLENNHVIDANQVWVGVVGTGVTGKRLNSSYNFRSTDEYLLELGNTIVNFTRLVPSGLLVFFPSYSILEASIARWQRPSQQDDTSSSIWDRIVQQKQVFVEPRGRLDFKEVVDEYHDTIKTNTNGAVFFAVCRGKVSEGIDFSNDKGRAVVITGLPFPPTKDPKIVLKKSILDDVVVPPGELKLTGNHWYIQQASRAVNQAIGRVIRHRHDYGAIILLDERFALQQQQKCLSKWLQPYCFTCRSYGEAHIGLTRFFKSNRANNPPPAQAAKAAFAPQPKSLGLSKRALSRSSSSLSAHDTAHSSDATQDPGHLSTTTPAIGDGQSYVNPELFRQPASSAQPATSVADASYASASAMPSRAVATASAPLRKPTLNALFSTTKSAMVESTSSISRPFVPPKARVSLAPSESVAPAAAPATPTPALQAASDLAEASSSSAASKKKSGTASQETPRAAVDTPVSADEVFVSVFPAVARSALSEADVSKLYALIRQLHTSTDVDAVVASICALLRAPACKDLVNLMPNVLKGATSDRFVTTAVALGLPLDLSLVPTAPARAPANASSHSRALSAPGASANMATFFERIQQKRKRKLHDAHMPTAAVVEDPQCIVCYDISRKAYAAQCGHICCMGCWKKMEKDGFTSCPLCKLPLKFEQLSLIRAAKKPSTAAAAAAAASSS